MSYLINVSEVFNDISVLMHEVNKFYTKEISYFDSPNNYIRIINDFIYETINALDEYETIYGIKKDFNDRILLKSKYISVLQILDESITHSIVFKCNNTYSKLHIYDFCIPNEIIYVISLTIRNILSKYS